MGAARTEPDAGRGQAQARGVRWRRLTIAGLSAAGFLDALYMLAYHEGLIESLLCPFFGEGCNVVGRSEHARHLGVPNAAVGAVGFAAMATLAVWAGDAPPEERPWQPVGLAGLSGAALAVSLFLTYEQGAKVRAWCFWCLLSAGLNAAIFPLSLVDGVPAWRALRRHGPTSGAPAR